MHVTDEILRATGGPDIPQGLLAWYKAGGAVANSLDEAEREFLFAKVRGSFGAEGLTDPNFSNTVYWTEGPGWLVGANKATIDGSNTATSRLSNQNGGPWNGTFLVRLGMTAYTTGEFQFGIGALRYGLWAQNKPGMSQAILTITGISGSPLIEASIGAIAELYEFSMRPITAFITTQWQTNDMWFAYLRSLGYTGAFNDMWLQYWAAQP